MSESHQNGVIGYVAGNARTDADRIGRNGWIVGVFFDGDPTESGRLSRDLEVKYWEFPAGGGQNHNLKTSATVEWSMILSGRVIAALGGDHIELGAGDYVLIHPGTPNNLVDTVLENVVAITIKSPSDPTAKKVIG